MYTYHINQDIQVNCLLGAMCVSRGGGGSSPQPASTGTSIHAVSHDHDMAQTQRRMHEGTITFRARLVDSLQKQLLPCIRLFGRMTRGQVQPCEDE